MNIYLSRFFCGKGYEYKNTLDSVVLKSLLSSVLLCLLLPFPICSIFMCTCLPIKSSLTCTSAEALLAFISLEELDVLQCIHFQHTFFFELLKEAERWKMQKLKLTLELSSLAKFCSDFCFVCINFSFLYIHCKCKQYYHYYYTVALYNFWPTADWNS